MPELVNLKINGQAVSVPRGTYLLEAAKMHGIDIPNFCYQKELRPWGSCRICTVEILGRRGGLIESCATPVREGMEVATHSPACLEARQEILKLYLVDHALDCAICDASGECFLQDYTYEHGVSENPYRRSKRKSPTLHFSDLVDYNWDRCIMCSRCSRVCDEVIGASALSFTSRGLEAEIAPAFGNSLNDTPCTHCGMCIQVCPVGALTDRWYGNHPWRVQKTQTVCSLCSAGCTVELWREDNELVKAQGVWDTGVNQGWTCVKGRWGHDFVRDERRLTRPMLRRGGRLETVSWSEALTAVAERLATHQHDFAMLVGGKATNEEGYVFQQFARAVMGSNAIESDARRAWAPADAVLESALGVAAATNPATDLLQSGCIVLVGANVAEEQPVISYSIVRAVKGREARLIVISPTRPSVLADMATLWLPARAGTESLVLQAMAKVVVDEGLTDEAYIKARTTGQAALTRALAKIDLDEVASTSGVPADDIVTAARLYGRGGALGGDRPERGWVPSAIAYGVGAAAGPAGGSTVQAIVNLAVLTGNVGRAGGGVLPLRLEANDQGLLDMGVRGDRLPGGAALDDEAARAALEALWLGRWGEAKLGALPITRLSTQIGPSHGELWAAVQQGQIGALWVVGDDPVLLDRGAREALESLDSLIVQDTFLSETAQLATIVLPSSAAPEKDGTYTSTGRQVQRLRAAVAPVGESRADEEIVRAVARRLGYEMPYRQASDILDEIAQVVPAYAGVSMARLESGPLAWPVSAADQPGTAVLHLERFQTASGKVGLVVPATVDLVVSDMDYPLQLVMGNSIFQSRSGAVTRSSVNLVRLEGAPRLEMSPTDASRLGLAAGESVLLETRYGSATLQVVPTAAAPPGTLFMDSQWGEAPGNILSATSGGATPARVSKAAAVVGRSSVAHAGVGRVSVV